MPDLPLGQSGMSVRIVPADSKLTLARDLKFPGGNVFKKIGDEPAVVIAPERPLGVGFKVADEIGQETEILS